MALVKSTVKGQVLIPVGIRRKFGITKGTLLNVYDDGKRILLEAIPDDPVVSGRGALRSGGKVLRSLLEERRKEAEL